MNVAIQPILDYASKLFQQQFEQFIATASESEVTPQKIDKLLIESGAESIGYMAQTLFSADPNKIMPLPTEYKKHFLYMRDIDAQKDDVDIKLLKQEALNLGLGNVNEINDIIHLFRQQAIHVGKLLANPDNINEPLPTEIIRRRIGGEMFNSAIRNQLTQKLLPNVTLSPLTTDEQFNNNNAFTSRLSNGSNSSSFQGYSAANNEAIYRRMLAYAPGNVLMPRVDPSHSSELAPKGILNESLAENDSQKYQEQLVRGQASAGGMVINGDPNNLSNQSEIIADASLISYRMPPPDSESDDNISLANVNNLKFQLLQDDLFDMEDFDIDEARSEILQPNKLNISTGQQEISSNPAAVGSASQISKLSGLSDAQRDIDRMNKYADYNDNDVNDQVNNAKQQFANARKLWQQQKQLFGKSLASYEDIEEISEIMAGLADSHADIVAEQQRRLQRNRK